MEKELAQLQLVNKLYKETAANELLLKEQISSLQASVQRGKEERLVIPHLECELKKVKDRLHEWESLAENLLNVSNLTQVGSQIEDMRRRELKLTDDVGNLTVELNAVNRLSIFITIILLQQVTNNSHFEFRTNLSLKDEILALKQENRAKTELEDRLRKLERKLIVVQKDRDHYRNVNEMYEREMTHIGGSV